MPVVNVPGGGQSRNLARPNRVLGMDPYIHNRGWLYVNPAAFSMPAPGTYSNLARNALRGPSITQLDLTLSKKIPVRESMNFELWVEAYNILNSPVYGIQHGWIRHQQAIPGGAPVQLLVCFS